MLKIGWSKKDVSTEMPVNIPGQFHMRISKGILDPITLNCLVVEGEDIVIFLSGDFVGGGRCIDVIRAKVKNSRPDFPAEKIIFNVTHTHCGGDIYKNQFHMQLPLDGIDVYPSVDYREFVTEKAVEAIFEAYDRRQEGYIAYGYGFAPVAHSRRSTYSDDLSLRAGTKYGARSSLAVDGHAKMYGRTRDDKFMGYEGGADHYANFMFTFDTDKKLTGAIINIPCPSQCSEEMEYLTADYWHNVREILYKKYGDIGILPQCAAAGDLSPRPLHYLDAEARRNKLKYGAERKDRFFSMRKIIAEYICAAFDEVLPWAKKELFGDLKVGHTVKTIALEKLKITKDQYDLARAELAPLMEEEIPEGATPSETFKNRTVQAAKINRFRGIIDRYESQEKEPFENMELHAVSIGDIAFATNAFELYSDYQHRIQARSPFLQTFIVQLADQPENGAQGSYLATERALENLGYSACIYSCRTSPEGGQTLVEETLSALSALYESSSEAL